MSHVLRCVSVCEDPGSSDVVGTGGGFCIENGSVARAGAFNWLAAERVRSPLSVRGESSVPVLFDFLLTGVLAFGVRTKELRRESLPNDCLKLERLLE